MLTRNGFPLFGTLFPCAGDRIIGVFDVKQKIDEGLYTCLRVPCNSPALIEGATLQIGRVSIYDGFVNCIDDVLMFSVQPDTWWTAIHDIGDDLSSSLIDLCAGTGAMSIGAKFLGGDSIAVVDWNQVSIDMLKQTTRDQFCIWICPTLTLQKSIHQACQGPTGTTFMGFPCQPHSFQGQRRAVRTLGADLLAWTSHRLHGPDPDSHP